MTATSLATVQRAPSPLLMLQAAIDNPQVDPARLEKYMELYERWERREAEKAYSAAMGACQAEMRPIERNAWNDQTKSHYLNLENVHAQLKPIWLTHGFTLSSGSDTSPLPNHYRAVMDVRHCDGHVTRHVLDGPCDDRGMKGSPNKTPIQGVVSTMSYLERKLTCMVFNITLKGEDKDGNRTYQSAAISQEQEVTIREWIDAKGADLAAFLKAFDIEKLSDLPAAKFANALDMLKRRKQGPKQ